MRFAYADPPYLGLAAKFYGDLHPDAADYDRPEKHQELIDRLCSEFDGWALSLHTPSLREILPMCPPDVRVMAWCKSFASWKPGVHPAYAWEPVIIRGARTRSSRAELTVVDYCVVPITLRRGFQGAKPAKFVWWMLAALNVKADDEFVDLFPGSGAVTRAWDSWRNQATLALSVREATMTTTPGPRTDIRNVKMHRDLWEGQGMGLRTWRGEAITINWGEPDAEGFWTPTFTATDDGWLAGRKAEARADVDGLVARRYADSITEMQAGDKREARADVDGLVARIAELESGIRKYHLTRHGGSQNDANLCNGPDCIEVRALLAGDKAEAPGLKLDPPPWDMTTDLPGSY